MKYVHPGPLVQKCVTMAKHAIKPLNFDPQNLYFSIFRLVLSNDRVLFLLVAVYLSCIILLKQRRKKLLCSLREARKLLKQRRKMLPGLL